MKITQDHFNHLHNEITTKWFDVLNNHNEDFNRYMAQGHSDKRIIWDFCHLAGLTPFICDTLYTYLNDTHIETALLKILKGLK